MEDPNQMFSGSSFMPMNTNIDMILEQVLSELIMYLGLGGGDSKKVLQEFSQSLTMPGINNTATTQKDEKNIKQLMNMFLYQTQFDNISLFAFVG